VPHLYLIAGPNGAGKTTFASRFLPEFVSVRQFVNADLIASGMSPFAPESAAIEAGRLMLRRIDALARQKADFGIETTLASKTLQTRLRALKAASYQIHLAYLWLASPELAVARVQERVRQGGHSVPETTIRRRYFSGLRNLFNVYMSLADDWFIYDNSHTSLEKIAFFIQGQTHIQNPQIFKIIERLAKS
jgi:predicted ABC-type ATPase